MHVNRLAKEIDVRRMRLKNCADNPGEGFADGADDEQCVKSGDAGYGFAFTLRYEAREKRRQVGRVGGERLRRTCDRRPATRSRRLYRAAVVSPCRA